MPILSLRGRDERDELYPAAVRPLVTEQFIGSFDLFEDYIDRQALAIARAIGLAGACRDAATLGQAVARAGLDARIAPVPVAWLLDMLAQAGLAVRSATGTEVRYRIARDLPEADAEGVRAAQARHDPACLPAYDIAALAASHYPAVLRGEISGEQALFGPDGILPWVKYFSNDNPIYAISNRIGAIAALEALPAGAIDVLELGGGLGSGADALLRGLAGAGRADDVRSYRLTDVSPLFLKRAQRNLQAGHPGAPLAFGHLDIDRPFADQGIAPGACSLAYGVNVLHVARDLETTLASIRESLRPGGLLVMAECVRPFEGRAFPLELVFNLLESFREAKTVLPWRPNGGFLTPAQWRGALQANGFADARIYPDVEAIRAAYPSFVCAALVARRLD
jgi:SAM-dependent methyltransferase